MPTYLPLTNDLELELELELDNEEVWKLKEKKASILILPDNSHDKNKNRKITATGKQYLYELKITDAQGKVRPHGQDKYKQINHYIEILSSLLEDLPKKEHTNIADMGSGKGYLTFALYDYLNYKLQVPTSITGVEFREDLVSLCNEIAAKSNFNNLHFAEGSIEDFKYEKDLDVLIALHACDTATDDAIYQGIQSNAELIVVAPCCHKQIRREMQKGKTHNETEFLTKHGIFMERQAEMVTDGLRALILELMGYATKIFEFISTEHTPKNVLLVAQKRKKPLNNQAELLDKIATSKKFFGIENHHLESLIDLRKVKASFDV